MVQAPRLLPALLGLFACTQVPDSPPPNASRPFASAAELEGALEKAARTGNADVVWSRLRAQGSFPIVFGRTAHFFYRGEGRSVEWRSEFTEWWPSWDAPGERVGKTDIWRKTLQLAPGSRLDYKIVVDGEWMLDPHNPFQQVGGYGPNSEARMPDWVPSPYVTRLETTPKGTLSDDLPIESQHLGYTVNIRVYTPPGLPGEARDLPTLFVTDGSDYYRDEMGASVIILDRLYEEGKLAPIVVVFVDPWDPEHTKNRREEELIPPDMKTCTFCDFLVDEVIPYVGQRFPQATRKGSRRGIMGTSNGGLHATYMGLIHAQHFGRIGIQSPAYFGPRRAFVWEQLMKAESFPSKVFLDVGIYERRYLYYTRRATEHLKKIGVELEYVEAPQGHSWGHWRQYFDDALLHLFGDEPT